MSNCFCKDDAVVVKRPAWSRLYNFDFTRFEEVAGGDDLLSPVVTATPSGLTVGAPAVSGGVVQVQISGGASGTVYALDCACQTTSGAALSVAGRLIVSEPEAFSGSRTYRSAWVTELYGTAAPAKRRAVALDQGAACAGARLAVLDPAGDPVDLSAYPPERYTVAGAVREALGRAAEGALYFAGSVVDHACGLVELPVPAPAANNPGVYLLEAVLTDDEPYPRCAADGEVVTAMGAPDAFTYRVTTTGGDYDYPLGVTPCVGLNQALVAKQQLVRDVCLVLSNTLYLLVERGLFGVPGQDSYGPPTLAEVRLHLRDFPETNLLLDEYEFDAAEVAMAAERAVAYFNEAPPPIQRRFTTLNFPFRYHWLEGVCYQLYLTAAAWHRRNRLPYSAGGVTVDDVGKEQEYLRAAALHEKNWKDFVRMRRVSMNMEEGFDSLGSDYGYGQPW